MTKIKVATSRLLSLILLLTLFIQSCEESEPDDTGEQITVSISDFTTRIDENPISGTSLGTLVANTNQGNLNFTIIQQSPNQAIEINASTGEIFVLTPSLFDYETNPVITGMVRASNSGISNSASITINLDDLNDQVDDYKLLSVSDLGEVFEIGNITGDIESVGQISRENTNSILSTNNLIASADKIYAIEYVYNPSPTNNLLIFDRQNKTTEIIPLSLPPHIIGDEKGIIALALDDENLIAILAENVLINNATKHIININLQDFSVNDLEINFNENALTSMKKINSKLYIATWVEGFLDIDLTTKSIERTSSINGSRMAQISSSELALMQHKTGTINGAQPGIVNLENKTIADHSNGAIYGLVSVFGNSIYKDQAYLNLIGSNSLNLYFGILKTNFETNENTIVEVNTTNVNRNMVILDTTN